MKKLILVLGLFSGLQAAASYIYFQNPTYCRTDWTCDIVSTDWSNALEVCEKEAFARSPATVYQNQNGKMTFKGYGCYDPLYVGGGN